MSTVVGRTKSACHNHWERQILPILKRELLGLPQTVEWMEQFLRYIVDNKITSSKKIPYDQVSKEICRGETRFSISHFASSLSQEWKGGKLVRSKDPLYEICDKKLNEPSLVSYLGNEEKANSKLDYINQILEIKHTILKGL